MKKFLTLLLQKAQSRKFWVAICTFVSGLILAFKGESEIVETVTGLIMSAASVIAYAIGEGLADSAHTEPVDLKKIDWARKLTSRKFLLALAGLVSGLVIAFNGGEEIAETISGVLMTIGSAAGYIFGEGLSDATRRGTASDK